MSSSMIDVPDEPPPSIRMTRPRMAGSPACVLDRPRRVLLVCAVALWGAFASPPAHAEPEAFVSAYKAGKTALQSGAFQDALDHFRLSLRQAGEHQAASWKGMIGVAFAFRGLDEPGYALEYYRRFLDGSAQHESMLPPKWRARREAVQAEVAELDVSVTVDRALAEVQSKFPGATVDDSYGLDFEIPIDHPWFRVLEIEWENEAGGMVDDCDLWPPARTNQFPDRNALKVCLEKVYGTAEASEVDHLKKLFNYGWQPKSMNSMTLHDHLLSVYLVESHWQRESKPSQKAWTKLLRTLDGCGS